MENVLAPRSQVRKFLSKPECLEFITEVIKEHPGYNMREVARVLCDKYSFFDTLGRPQITSAYRAISVFIKRKQVPPIGLKSKKQYVPSLYTAEILPPAVPEPTPLPPEAGDVQDLKLIIVDNPELAQIWATMIDTDHPLGNTRFAGYQIRYLISSVNGWLGGLCFAASALNLSARDRWIGWNQEQRFAGLDNVCCMSRFLLRPCIKCKNLASKIISMSVARLREDFYKRYRFNPILIETFVELEHHIGTSYRAANWIEVGQTLGRGRNDRNCIGDLGKKLIFMYAYEPNFRELLGLPRNAGLSPLYPTEWVLTEEWLDHELPRSFIPSPSDYFQYLPDIFSAWEKYPDQPFASLEGLGKKAAQAYNRYLTDRGAGIAASRFLAGHAVQIDRRMQTQKIVLCVLGGMRIRFSAPLRVKRANVWKKVKPICAYLYTTLALTEDGFCLGVAKHNTTYLGISDDDGSLATGEMKENDRMCLNQLRYLNDSVRSLYQTNVIAACKRYEVSYEFLQSLRELTHIKVIVRVMRNSAFEHSTSALFALVEAEKEAGEMEVSVLRDLEPLGRNGETSQNVHTQRSAKVVVRMSSVTMQPPDASAADAKPQTASLIYVLEKSETASNRVEWLLVTTAKVQNFSKAKKFVEYYAFCRKHEEYNRVLNFGCRVSNHPFTDETAFRRSLAMQLLIAWRLMILQQMGRPIPKISRQASVGKLKSFILRKLESYPGNEKKNERTEAENNETDAKGEEAKAENVQGKNWKKIVVKKEKKKNADKQQF